MKKYLKLFNLYYNFTHNLDTKIFLRNCKYKISFSQCTCTIIFLKLRYLLTVHNVKASREFRTVAEQQYVGKIHYFVKFWNGNGQYIIILMSMLQLS